MIKWITWISKYVGRCNALFNSGWHLELSYSIVSEYQRKIHSTVPNGLIVCVREFNWLLIKN